MPSAPAFDVELLSRLLAPGEGVARVEVARLVGVPLNQWHDNQGARFNLADVEAGHPWTDAADTKACRPD